MRDTFFLLLIGIGSFACGPSLETDTGDERPEPTPNIAEPLPRYDLTFVPGERVGSITPTTTPAELRSHYGADQVRDTVVYVGEGFRQSGAIIFPERPERLELTWLSDSLPRPEVIYIRRPDSPWTSVASGVHIGTTLEELQALNGRPFLFSGFGWDYGGTILDWRGGELAGLTLRLEIDGERFPDKIMGDRPFASDLAEARALGIRVGEIYVVLNRPEE